MMRLSIFVSFSACSSFPIHIFFLYFPIAFYGIDVEGLIVCAYAHFFISSSFLVYILFKDERVSAARHGTARHGMAWHVTGNEVAHGLQSALLRSLWFSGATEKRPKRLFS